MATFNKYTNGVTALVTSINSGTDAWKVALANTVTVTDTTFTPGTSDLPTGGGYTSGGNPATVASSSNSGGVYKLTLNSPATWTASTTGFGPFRYAILWDSTTSSPLGYWDYGSSITASGTNGDTFTITLDATNGTFTVT